MPNIHYELLDSGHRNRLERFQNRILLRPDNLCLWHPKAEASLWEKADALYQKDAQGNFYWKTRQKLDPWPVHFEVGEKSLVFLLRLGPSKNIGVFPEQVSNWEWIQAHLKPGSKVLNLFAYTGGASLISAHCGAEVTHVDASKAAISWAKENQQLNYLDPRSIRWIEEDCLSFMQREIKRKNSYDAIILDPPAFGRDPKGRQFSFETHIHALLKAAQELLSSKAQFLLINTYTSGYPPSLLHNLLLEYFPNQSLDCGELQIKHADQMRDLSCGIYGRVLF